MREPLRFTPAGIPVSTGRLQHESDQVEDGHPRRVALEVEWLLAGQSARLLAAAPLGALVRAEGFLAPKARTRQQLVLHITEFELQGEDDGDTIGR